MNRIALNKRTDDKFDFHLPEHLQCSKPTEVRGIARDEVKLMVSHIHNDAIEHGLFRDIADYLQPGDVLVVNTSGTLKSALEGCAPDGTALRIHLSTQQAHNHWVLELRQLSGEGSSRYHKAKAGDLIKINTGGTLRLVRPYYNGIDKGHLKLWIAHFDIPMPVMDYLDRYGKSIRYNYIKNQYPQSYYQTVFANEMGSAEMPSAGRAFTPELVARLIAKGVQIVPVLLHTGVASLEIDERPYDEYYRISEVAAQTINTARRLGKRIIATGTTVIRTLETVTTANGLTKSGEGWTNVFINPERGLYAVDALITGMHEPRASHLLMLEALCGLGHLRVTYQEAVEKEYLWHEFGDLHLILP